MSSGEDEEGREGGEERRSSLFAFLSFPLRPLSNRFQYYPIVLSNIEPDLQDVVLPLSWIQKEIIIPYVLTQKSRGFWDVSRV